MEPLAILVVLPLAAGAAAACWFDDVRAATLAAVIVTAVGVCVLVALLDQGLRWGWIAALLTTPLTAAFAAAAALACHFQRDARRRRRARRT